MAAWIEYCLTGWRLALLIVAGLIVIGLIAGIDERSRLTGRGRGLHPRASVDAQRPR